MYEFFKNTGIQFFGQSTVGLDFDKFVKEKNPTDDSQNEHIYEYSYRILLNEWLPLSLDGKRNLLRFRLGKKTDGEHFILYCFDTTIRDNEYDSNSLIKDN